MPAAARCRCLALPVLILAFFTLSIAPGAQAPAPAPYRILVTNDDGVRAPGLEALVGALRDHVDLTVVAPAENQSAVSQAITIAAPIYVDRVALSSGQPAFAVAATPATCVELGVGVLMSSRPDLVVSGINRGANPGRVAYVSGTVGAARAAAMLGIPAVAASLAAEESDYSAAAAIVRQVIEMVRKNGLPRGSFLNVNVPAGAPGAIKGIQLTTQSESGGRTRFEEQKTPWGRRYFWSVWNEPSNQPEGTDVWAMAHGYAAVTPLSAGEFDARTYQDWRARVTGVK
jgi:5'-nucleotidase